MILDDLKSRKILLCDGAWGTLLLTKGLKIDECLEYWNVSHEAEILNIAKSYIAAGSDIIQTNSFCANRFKLEKFDLEEQTYIINKKAAEISRSAAKDKYVAGSISSTGKLLLTGEVTEDELYDTFKEQAIALYDGGSDIILIETMTDINEALIAIKAAKENTKCVIAATMTFDNASEFGYRTIMGISPEEMTDTFVDSGVDIIGSNCGNGISEMIDIVKSIRNVNRDIPILAQPNAGMPKYKDGKTIYEDTPAIMAAFIPKLIDVGANIIGGCCGTTLDHIHEFRKMLDFLSRDS